MKAINNDWAFMVVNMRGRIKDCTSNYEGNYNYSGVFSYGDYETPDLIRYSLNHNIQRKGFREKLT